MAEPRVPQPERQLTVEQTEQLPEFIKIAQRAYYELAESEQLEVQDSVDQFVASLYTDLEAAQKIGVGNLAEQKIAVVHLVSILENPNNDELVAFFKSFVDRTLPEDVSANVYKKIDFATEIEPFFEKERDRVIRADKIPREEGDGTVDLHVVVDREGNVHTPDLTLFKPIVSVVDGKKVVKQENVGTVHFNLEGIKLPISPGPHVIAFRVKKFEKNSNIIKLELPKFMFSQFDIVRPVEYKPDTGVYILANGDGFAIPRDSLEFIDKKTGFALNVDRSSTNTFPFVELKRANDTDEWQDERRIEKLEKIYDGDVIPPKELAVRLEIAAAFEQYYHKTTQTKIDRSPYRLSPQEDVLIAARKEIREASVEYPLDVVVSSAGGAVNAGFQKFLNCLAPVAEKNRILADELQGLCLRAEESFKIFYKQAEWNIKEKRPNKELLKNQDHWNDYVRFFKRMNDSDAAELFDGLNVRRQCFPSDLDGETAIELYEMAGIKTCVIPFVPDNARNGLPYLKEAIHIDITHGSGYKVRRSESATLPFGGVTIFLDEDDQEIFSATHATFDHLKELRFLKENEFVDYLIDYIDQEDSYKGLYESQDICEQIMDNGYQNVFGLGKQYIEEGKYGVVLDFFRHAIPAIKKQIISERPGFGEMRRSRDLKEKVMQELVTRDARPFFSTYNKDITETTSNKLLAKKERSYATSEALKRGHFACETKFGWTLFDPFSALEHVGLAAFAEGYDCYVSYNARLKIGLVNISPFQRQNVPLRSIPRDLYQTKRRKPIGQIIKGGRYLAMNASSEKFENFLQMFKAIQIEQAPQGIIDYVNAEDIDRNRPKGSQEPYEKDLLYLKIIPKFAQKKRPAQVSVSRPTEIISPKPPVELPKPPVDLDDDPDPDPEPELELPEELPAQFAEYQNGFNAAISEIAVNPMKFGPEAHELRQRIVGALMGMSSEVGTIPAPGKINPRFELLDVHERAMVEDIKETMASAAGKLRASNIEQAIGAHDRTEFLRVFFDQAMIDAGLDIYEAVIDSEEIDEIFAEWVKTI